MGMLSVSEFSYDLLQCLPAIEGEKNPDCDTNGPEDESLPNAHGLRCRRKFDVSRASVDKLKFSLASICHQGVLPGAE